VASGSQVAVQFVSGGSYSISVTAVIPGVTFPCNPTDTQAFQVTACCPQLIGPLNASEKVGDPCTWLFSAQVSNPTNAQVSYSWAFHDGQTATTALPQVEHTYAAGSTASGSSTVTLKSPGCPDQSLTVMVNHNCGKTPPPPPIETPPPTEMTIPCWILLILALIFIILAAVLAIIASCTGNNFYVFLASAISFIIGMILLALWGIFCARTACPILITVIDILAALSAASVVIAFILNFFGCGLGTFVSSGYLGTALAAAYAIGRFTGCIK
jgi:hypothetical protein